MLKVKYEKYHCDYARTNETATFNDLNDFTRWIYEKARVWQGKPDVFFTNPERHALDGSDLGYDSLQVDTGKYIYWNFCIEDNARGIIFTTGKFTYGKKHWSKDMREWFRKGCKGELQPNLKFAD